MKLSDILSISGKPGLYKFVAQGGGGIIVESLADKKRTNVPATSKVSALVEIAIYTDTEDLPLSEIFTRLYAHTEGKPTISHLSEAKEMSDLLEEIVPNYDTNRVHNSDMKKMIAWFNTLVEAGMSDFSVEEQDEEEQQSQKKQMPKKQMTEKQTQKKQVVENQAPRKQSTRKQKSM